MGEALRKITEAKPSVDGPVIEPSTNEPASSDLPAVPSPARALQSRLDKHFALRNAKFSGRFITFLVFGTCAATWLSGVGLYATL